WSGEEPSEVNRQRRLVRYLAEESPAAVAFRETDLRGGPCPEGAARDFLWRKLGIPTATLELSYHLAQSGEYLTPRHYRGFGKAAIRAIDRYLQEHTPAPE